MRKQSRSGITKKVGKEYKNLVIELMEHFDVIYEVFNTPEFIEMHGTMGGDVLCFRAYKDSGEIFEK